MQLANELARAMDHDELVAGGCRAHDVDGAFDDQKELGDLLTLFDQQLAGRDRSADVRSPRSSPICAGVSWGNIWLRCSARIAWTQRRDRLARVGSLRWDSRVIRSVLDEGVVGETVEPALAALGRDDHGMVAARACFDAWRFGEESQQSVRPHDWHVRRCTHLAPMRTHSSQT